MGYRYSSRNPDWASVNAGMLGADDQLAEARAMTSASTSLDLIPFFLGRRFTSTLREPSPSLRVTSTVPSVCRVDDFGPHCGALRAPFRDVRDPR